MEKKLSKEDLRFYISYLSSHRDALINIQSIQFNSRSNLYMVFIGLYAISMSIAIPQGFIKEVNLIFGLIFLYVIIRAKISEKKQNLTKSIKRLDNEIQKTYNKHFNFTEV